MIRSETSPPAPNPSPHRGIPRPGTPAAFLAGCLFLLGLSALLAIAWLYGGDPFLAPQARLERARGPGKLFRGVRAGTAAGRLARQGIVVPPGTGRDYLAHIRDETEDVDVTSWTPDPLVATRFGEIILRIDARAVAGRIVPHHAPELYPDEREVLVRGRIEGAEVLLVLDPAARKALAKRSRRERPRPSNPSRPSENASPESASGAE